MLSQWIYHGIVADTYNEFMIQEQKNVHKQVLVK